MIQFPSASLFALCATYAAHGAAAPGAVGAAGPSLAQHAYTEVSASGSFVGGVQRHVMRRHANAAEEGGHMIHTDNDGAAQVQHVSKPKPELDPDDVEEGSALSEEGEHRDKGSETKKDPEGELEKHKEEPEEGASITATASENASLDLLSEDIDLCGPDATCDLWIYRKSCATIWAVECPGIDHEGGDNQVTVAAGCPDECAAQGQGPAVTAKETVVCSDDATFLDAQGNDCSVWEHLDCETAAGFDLAQLLVVQQHCRETCSLCDVGIDEEAHATVPESSVGFSFVVAGVDFTSFNSNPSTKTEFIDTVKEAISDEAGIGILPTNVNVELSAGSVHVEVSVTPPSGVKATDVAAILVSSTTLSNTLLTEINLLSDIASVASDALAINVRLWSHATDPTAPNVRTTGQPPTKPAPKPEVDEENEEEEDDAEDEDDEKDDDDDEDNAGGNSTLQDNSSAEGTLEEFEDEQAEVDPQITSPHPPFLDHSQLHRPACTLLVTPGQAVEGTDETADPPGGSRSVHKPRPCLACAEGCTLENRQRSLVASWSFWPLLVDNPIFDVAFNVQWRSIEGLQSEADRGVRHLTTFDISTVGEEAESESAVPFRGIFGAEVQGGGRFGDALDGRHFLEIRDSGIQRALPGRRQRGDLAECKRICLDCHESQILANLSTATRCELPQGMADSQEMLYRFRLGRAHVHGEPVPIPPNPEMPHREGQKGTEWEATVQDAIHHDIFTIGRVVLENLAPENGITQLTNQHGHTACTPCDSYYESAEVTGPFVLRPENVHVTAAAVEIERAEGPDGAVKNNCWLHRVAAVEGLRMRYESGPGVHPLQAEQHMEDQSKGTPTNMFTCP